MANRVAASLASPDTVSCLREIERLAPRIGLAEIRLDLMAAFDIDKLVGTAQAAADVLPVLEFLRDASTPVIGMAMGSSGICTRLMSPAFGQSLLTTVPPPRPALPLPARSPSTKWWTAMPSTSSTPVLRYSST